MLCFVIVGYELYIMGLIITLVFELLIVVIVFCCSFLYQPAAGRRIKYVFMTRLQKFQNDYDTPEITN